ncbi:hypothetical protein KIPB_016945, partial [Kipferlia bialata]
THQEADKSHLCATQGKGVGQPQRMSSHHRETRVTLPYKCPAKTGDGSICGMRFGTRDLLYSHICTAHSNPKPDVSTERHCCKTCQQVFDTQGGSHLVRQLWISPSLCPDL